MLAAGMNGIDLAEAARAVKPALAVVFMSGFAAAPEALERIRESGAPFLAKPFTTPQLDRTLRALPAPPS